MKLGGCNQHKMPKILLVISRSSEVNLVKNVGYSRNLVDVIDVKC